MKIAITGHTSGIGKALYNKFISEDYEVIGFSKSTGYDISNDSARQNILDTVKEFDVFINNAWHITAQEKMLNEILNMWKGSDKTVLNVSSNVKILPESFFENNEKIRNYRDSKKRLDEMVYSYTGTVCLLNILPELTNTNFGPGVPGYPITDGMDPEYVADKIYDFFMSKDSKELIIKHYVWMKLNGKL